MLHPACPAIARMSYYRSLESYGEYGACVTSPVWFAAASVLGAIAAAGMTIAQAADKLFVSRETVKKHLANIYGKLGVHSKMQAVALLRDAGIV